MLNEMLRLKSAEGILIKFAKGHNSLTFYQLLFFLSIVMKIILIVFRIELIDI